MSAPYRTIIVSDTHLGAGYDRLDLLAEFLNQASCNRLILNGDIIDGLHIAAHGFIPFSEGEKRVLDALHRRIAEGVEVVYIPGNHDAALRGRGFPSGFLNGARICDETELTGAAARRFLVTHGDRLGSAPNSLQNVPGLLARSYRLGYRLFARISNLIDRISGWALRRPLSLASKSRHAVARATGIISACEDKLIAHARGQKYDGVICGHFHVAAIKKQSDGFLYLNSGDWVESFTALTEDAQGDWRVVRWSHERHAAPDVTAAFNASAAFRPQTETTIAAIRTVWPGQTV